MCRFDCSAQIPRRQTVCRLNTHSNHGERRTTLLVQYREQQKRFAIEICFEACKSNAY